MRWIVWTKGQVIALLMMLLGLTIGITALAVGGTPPEWQAVEAFAEENLFSANVVAENSQTAPEITEEVADSPQTLPELPADAAPTPTADRTLRVQVIRDTPVPAQGKSILIYHTHTWEAYAQVPEAPYEETEKWRSKDQQANVVAVGSALTASLRALGFTVVHDTTAFEPPNLSSAYTRSLAMLEERQARGESYDLYIDLHRDAYIKGAGIAQTVRIGGEDVARLMVLVGKGTGSSFAVKPDWEANYALAERITAELNRSCADLCRRISLKSGRFNQHIAPHCVLIECGNNMNTLEEVLRSVPYLAQAIASTLTEAP